MTMFGYTLMTEEHDPRNLVANARRARNAVHLAGLLAANGYLGG